MDGYLQVCLIIVFASIISGLISGYKNKNFIKESLFYAGVYYYAVSAVRMFQGHATELLGHAMKDKNKQEYTGAREDIINKGYSPCGRCHP